MTAVKTQELLINHSKALWSCIKRPFPIAFPLPSSTSFPSLSRPGGLQSNRSNASVLQGPTSVSTGGGGTSRGGWSFFGRAFVTLVLFEHRSLLLSFGRFLASQSSAVDGMDASLA